MAAISHNRVGLPAASLAEIYDSLVLALDVSERPTGYSQAERECRSYLRHALRRTEKLMGVNHAAA